MMNEKITRVKFIGNTPASWLNRQLPKQSRRWGRCEFTFDVNDRDYDWLVVYNDLPQKPGQRRSTRIERLACRTENTLLITTEPPTIKIYSSPFTGQFGYVLTSYDERDLPHSHRIYSQPSLIWYYGLRTPDDFLDYDWVKAHPPIDKSKILSTVCSNKQQKHTLHNQRYLFTKQLKEILPWLDVYGHGVIEMRDKAEALDSYKYHIAIENFKGLHHWTEKLSDSFLGCTLPFYYGAPNASDYFPKNSFIPIDIFDVEGSAKIIRQAIENNEYERRLPAIMEARRLVLDKYNIIATVASIIEDKNGGTNADLKLTGTVMSRRLAATCSFRNVVIHLYEKMRLRLRNKLRQGKR